MRRNRGRSRGGAGMAILNLAIVLGMAGAGIKIYLDNQQADATPVPTGDLVDIDNLVSGSDAPSEIGDKLPMPDELTDVAAPNTTQPVQPVQPPTPPVAPTPPASPTPIDTMTVNTPAPWNGSVIRYSPNGTALPPEADATLVAATAEGTRAMLVPNGAVVTVTGWATPSWAKITYKNVQGYIYVP